MRVRKTFLSLLIFTLLITSFVFSQMQTGVVKGKVMDEKGKPIPGATVTIKGDTITKVYTTTDKGEFIFFKLPPGTYTVKSELSGFTPVEVKNVRVNVGKTYNLTIKIPLKVSEKVVVEAKPILLDTSSSKSSTTYSKELIEEIPMKKDVYDIIASAAGVVTDNITYSRTFATHGSSIRDNVYAFDGFMMNDPRHGYLSTNINYYAIEEVELQTSAHPAEVGEGTGSYINVVTKSGTNNLQGELNYYFTLDSLASDKPGRDLYQKEDAEYTPLKTNNSNDIAFNIGGPIVKNKLWFFTSYRYLGWKYTPAGYEEKDAVTHKEHNLFFKLTSNLSENLKLDTVFNYINAYEPRWEVHQGVIVNSSPYYVGWKYMPEAAPCWDHEKDITAYLKLNWTIDQNTNFDFRTGYIYKYFPLLMRDGTGYRTYDIAEGLFYGGYWMNEVYHRGRFQTMASLTKFLDNFLGGDHKIKLGTEIEFAKDDWDTWMPGKIGDLLPAEYFTENGSNHLFSIWWWGAGKFYARAIGTKSGDSVQKDRTRRFSFYFQDDFSLFNGRVYLNLGLRYDYSKAHIPAQHTTGSPQWNEFLQNSYWMSTMMAAYGYDTDFFAPRDYPEVKNYMNWKTLSPRLGISIDLTGDGKTAFKAFFGRYYSYMNIQYASDINPMYYPYIAFYWYDFNWNDKFDTTDYYEPMWAWGGYKNPKDRIDPNLKPPYTDEFVVSLERELFKDFSLSVRYIHRYEGNLIEDMDFGKKDSDYVKQSVVDPGWDGVLGTSDDKNYEVYFLVNSLAPSVFKVTNPKDAYRKYKGLEIVLRKAFSHGWQLLGSVTISKAEATLGNAFYETNGVSTAFDDPNYMVNRKGSDPTFNRPFLAKLQGTFKLPLDIFFSFNYKYMSGLPIQRSVIVVNTSIPNVPSWYKPEVLSEPIGTKRGPDFNQLDIRLLRDFKVGNNSKFSISVDIMNALGSALLYKRYGTHLTIYPDGTILKVHPGWEKKVTALGQRVIYFSLNYKF